jgi:hypothetical protein
VRLGRYLKEAFLNHWNLLAVGAGTAFGILAGRPDVVLPLVAAGEITYLGLLATHPRFQRAVDAQDARARRESGVERSAAALDRITSALPAESLRRYESLRSRVAELRQIAVDLRAPGPGERLPFETLQVRSLDRLLWIHLRLLYTEWSLGRFLQQTSEASIRRDIDRLDRQLAELPADEANPRRQKARQTVLDNLATSRARLANLVKAHENHELVQLEIDRLENKIRSVSELAVSRQEPEFISDQVDSVAASMVETERTMQELQFATGLTDADEQVPSLLERQVVAD